MILKNKKKHKFKSQETLVTPYLNHQLKVSFCLIQHFPTS